MGEAKTKGTYNRRRANAVMVDSAEVVICISHDGDKQELKANFILRDDPPNKESHAVIIANWMAHNWNTLARQAMVAYEQYMAEQTDAVAERTSAEALDERSSLITPTARPVLNADGE